MASCNFSTCRFSICYIRISKGHLSFVFNMQNMQLTSSMLFFTMYRKTVTTFCYPSLDIRPIV